MESWTVPPRAIQVGGRWTDGTGVTENGILVDGRMHKLGDDLRWSYDVADPAGRWRVRGERLDATLTPFHQRRDITELGVLAVKTWQAFGVWHGIGVLDDGTTVSLDGLVGWAESRATAGRRRVRPQRGRYCSADVRRITDSMRSRAPNPRSTTRRSCCPRIPVRR